MWPLPGLDAKKALGDFLKNRLLLSQSFLSGMGEVSIKKISVNPNVANRRSSEAVVVFATFEVRDAVRAAAKELNGDQTCGIRLEIPSFLQTNLKDLEYVCHAMKQKNPNLKRNVLFDDDAMDLMLDYTLDQAAGKPWRRMKPAKAREIKAILPPPTGGFGEITTAEISKMFDL